MKTPKMFGKRPILMLGYDGRLRIIYPNGSVFYSSYDSHSGIFVSGCTSGCTQEAAYKECCARDAYYYPHYSGDLLKNFSEFLGYL